MGSGIFRYDAPGAGVPIVRSGDPAPGGGAFDMLGRYCQNDAGGVAFWTDMPPRGLCCGDGTAITPVVAENDPAPVPPGGTFSMLDTMAPPSLNNLGQAAFGGGVMGGTAMSGVFRAGGTATVNGPVINEPAGKVEVAYQPAVFTGDVKNRGEFKVTDTTVTFAATYTENGIYMSDPADNYFQDVRLGAGGAFVGGAGDRFLVRGDFLSQTTAAGTWNTAEADLIFQRSGERRRDRPEKGQRGRRLRRGKSFCGGGRAGPIRLP